MISIWNIFIRSLLFHFSFYLLTFVLCVVGIPFLFFGRHAVLRLAHFWGQAMQFLLRIICNLRVEFRGVERLPKGAFILAPKHQSAWETLALIQFTPDFSFMLKRELLWIPVLGWYLKCAEQIALHRKGGAKSLQHAFETASHYLRQGRQLILFPEGTRRHPDAPPEYKSGIAHLYEMSRVPCVPVALNAGLFWERRSLLIRPGTILVEFLQPIPPGFPRQTFLHYLETVLESSTRALVSQSRQENPALPPKK